MPNGPPSRCLLRSPRAWLATFAGLVMLALAPQLASAATYFVKTGGSDGATGLSVATAWATIGRANSRVAPGDVVMVLPGTYGQVPSPVVTGTATKRITYIGSPESPSSVVINGGLGTISKNHLTIKGFRFTIGLTLTGTRDSLADCLVEGSRSSLIAANDCVVARCRFTGQRFWIVGTEDDSIPVAARDTVVDCVFTLRPLDAGGHTVRLQALNGCLIQRSRFDIVVGAGASGASPTKLFFVRNSQFTDNRWDITNLCTGTCDESGWFVLRDYTQSNTFVRDTVTLNGPGAVQFFGSASGSYAGTVMNNTFDQCVFKQIGPASYGAAFFYQDGAKWDTLTRNVIVGNASGLVFNVPVVGPFLIAHNTIASFAPNFGAMGLDDLSPWVGSVQVRDNIFYTAPSARHHSSSAPLVVSLGVVGNHIAGNRNVFFSGMKRDSAIAVSPLGMSRPGLGSIWTANTRADSNSVYGSPRFTDTTSVARFDARLGPGSFAIGAGSGGTDAGAIPAVTGPDVTAPATVVDLRLVQVTDNAMILRWTAPGDDGTTGTAAAYELRWSTQPITPANFATATRVTQQPAPAQAGTAQTYLLSGLTPGLEYFVAIRARDEAGNWSTPGNVLSATTLPFDTVPPTMVGSLKGN